MRDETIKKVGDGFVKETNTDMSNPDTWRMPKAKISIGTTVRSDLWTLAKKVSLPWNEAIEFGILFLLKESDVLEDYPECKLASKIKNFIVVLEEKSEKINEVEEEVRKKDAEIKYLKEALEKLKGSDKKENDK